MDGLEIERLLAVAALWVLHAALLAARTRLRVVIGAGATTWLNWPPFIVGKPCLDE